MEPLNLLPAESNVYVRMPMDGTIRLYEWIQSRFVPGAVEAEAVVESIGPQLRPLVADGTRVLDLCCGAGTWSVWLAGLGAQVEGVDIAAHMIARARSEAAERGVDATFVLDDVADRDHGASRFDLALLMGNSIADLSHGDFESVAKRMWRALVDGGRFVIHHLDGDEYLASAREAGGGVEQQVPNRITWRFGGVLPGCRSWVAIYRDASTGEELDYTTYVHTTRSIGMALDFGFELDRSAIIGRSELGVWSKRRSR